MLTKILMPHSFLRSACLSAALALSAPLAHASDGAVNPATSKSTQRPSVELAATASVEVEQDWLEVTLSTTRQGTSAQAVQRQLKQVITSTMAQLKTHTSPDDQALRVRTQNFGVYPQYGKNGKIAQWQGQAQIVLSGRDFDRITQAAAQVGDMAIEDMHFALSEAGRERVMGQALQQALATFNQRAQAIAQGLGHRSWSAHHITVDHHDVGSVGHFPRQHLEMAAMSKSTASYEAEAAAWVEPGVVRVRVDVNGSVTLKP